MKTSLLCLALLCATAYSYSSGGDLQKFYIGGLFPDNADDFEVRNALGIYPKLAAQLAVKHINEAGLLAAHNFSFEMVSYSTSCQKDSATYAYLQLMEVLELKSGMLLL